MDLNEIRWDHENEEGLSLKEKFEKLLILIEYKMKGRSGLIKVNEHNYLLFAASTSGNFDHDPKISFYSKSWFVVKDSMLDKNEIRIYPDNK